MTEQTLFKHERDEELNRRLGLWAQINEQDRTDLEPSLLRGLAIYGGAAGIWVNKDLTSGASPNEFGVTVSLLHTGRHYPDELAQDGAIYHYPVTARAGDTDRNEVEATKNAGRAKLPVFFILPGDKSQKRRRVELAWVEGWDDDTQTFLILFGEDEPTYAPLAEPESPFSLTDDTKAKYGKAKYRPNQARFRFNVLEQYGCKCAVCDITLPRLIQAAHLRGKENKGSDDWRNGLPLCLNHHAALDAGMFAIQPNTMSIMLAPGCTKQDLGLENETLNTLQNAPHPRALQWRWEKTAKAW